MYSAIIILLKLPKLPGIQKVKQMDKFVEVIL